MRIVKVLALIGLATLLAACVTRGETAGTIADNSNGCRKVHIAGTRFPKTICGTGSQGLTDLEKDKLREAIGGSIVTEQN